MGIQDKKQHENDFDVDSHGVPPRQVLQLV
jgi:hypothetical protein